MQPKLIILALFGLAGLGACSNKASTDNAQIEATISPVIPRINGTVTRVLVDDNDRVKEGDTLIVLDDAPFKIAVAQAEVALLQATRNVDISKVNRNTASVNVNNAASSSAAIATSLEAARASIDAAKTRLDLATKNYERAENLLKVQSVTQQQFDIANTELQSAQAQYRVAVAQEATLRKQVEASQYQVASVRSSASNSATGISVAELNVRQAQNALDLAKLNLSYCYILAPSAGIVSKKSVEKGEVVSVGQPLMAVTFDQHMWVIANFKETQVDGMMDGQDVTIDVDAYPSKRFHGKVQSFAAATGAKFSLLPPDNATGNFVKVTQRIPVKILITDSADGAAPLRAGMSVSVTVKKN